MVDSEKCLWMRESLSVNFCATTDSFYNYIGSSCHEYHTNSFDASVWA